MGGEKELTARGGGPWNQLSSGGGVASSCRHAAVLSRRRIPVIVPLTAPCALRYQLFSLWLEVVSIVLAYKGTSGDCHADFYGVSPDLW